MNIKGPTEFVEKVDEERFKKSRDRLMKQFESDLQLIAWLAWCSNLFQKNLSFEQMADFVENNSSEELKKYINPIDVHIFSEDIYGVILDKFFEIKENNKVVGIFGVENQLQIYPYGEILARGVVDMVASIFYGAGAVVDRKNYRNLPIFVNLWAFPKVPKKIENTLRIYPDYQPTTEFELNMQKGQDHKLVKKKPRFKLDCCIYQHYVGDPLDINVDQYDEDIRKLVIQQLLIDSICCFEVDKEKRLQILAEKFKLKGPKINEEVSIMGETLTYYGDMRLHEGIEIGKNEGIEIGKNEGIEIGVKEERERNLNTIIKNLIKDSEESGKIITEAEAKKMALHLLRDS